jgi:nitroreductase
MSAEGFDLPTVDKLLTTTRAVRKRLDLNREVPVEVVLECLRLAIQAPTGGNLQTWRWLIITDPELRRKLEELYRYDPPPDKLVKWDLVETDWPARKRLLESTDYLQDHLHEVPVLVIPCVATIQSGAAGPGPSIYPAVWSFMLALRSRGLGSVLTGAHLYRRAESDKLLGIPDGYEQACLIPVAYYTGTDFKPAGRRPIEEVAFLNDWGNPISLEQMT